MADKLIGMKLVKIFESGRTEIVDFYDNSGQLLKENEVKEKKCGKLVIQAMYIINYVVNEYSKAEDKNKFISTSMFRRNIITGFEVAQHEFHNINARDCVTRKMGLSMVEFRELLKGYIVGNNRELYNLMIDKWCKLNDTNRIFIEEEFDRMDKLLNFK